MKFKFIIFILLIFSLTISGCGRKTAPLKPLQTIEKS